MTTRARASAGNGRGPSSLRAAVYVAPSGRKPYGATDRRRAACPASPCAVVTRRYDATAPEATQSARRCGDRPTVPTILLPSKLTVKGARCARMNSLRSPLTVSLDGKAIGTYQVGRGRLAASAAAEAKRTENCTASRVSGITVLCNFPMSLTVFAHQWCRYDGSCLASSRQDKPSALAS